MAIPFPPNLDNDGVEDDDLPESSPTTSNPGWEEDDEDDD